jgi:ABC-type multidrug transport system ATPase subunit
MADIVGIVSAGRLVTQGPLDELLAGQALVRVKVKPEEAAAALAVVAKVAGDGHTEISDPDAAWLTSRVPADRAAEINRALAGAGIYASGLEAGSDLESLFLQLTATPEPPPVSTRPGAIPGWNSGV